ncbi:oxidoreductase [Thozetella sp. PMI_491]|nr:oxidoreductase [Thozetella sp. PMI_491]
MSKLQVLVVGASIAGPATAYWLAKAGARVTVIERFPQLRTNGQAVDIRTAGVTVMRKMPGMEDAVRTKKVDIHGINFVNSDGRPYATIKPTGNPDQQSLVSEYEIYRGDLAQVLFDLTKDNERIRYVFGEQVTAIRQNEPDSGPVTVEFANGLPPAEYDLVVACDGATSRTRAIGLGCGVRDYVEPMNCWAAYFSIERDLLGGSKLGHAYSAVGGRFIAMGSDPTGVTRATFMCINPRGPGDAARPFREAMKQGDDEVKQFLARYYEGAGWRADEVVKGMLEAQDFYAGESVQVRVPVLHKGRFALVGDSGYAPGPTGAGTTLALVGAYTLAGEIAKHDGDLVAGLRGYEERMRPIVSEMQHILPFVPAIFAPRTAWGIWLRNTLLAIVTRSRILDLAQRFFGGAFATVDKYPLPEYQWVN